MNVYSDDLLKFLIKGGRLSFDQDATPKFTCTEYTPLCTSF